jgi:hypothetical protein
VTGRENRKIIIYITVLVVLVAAVAWGIAESGSC